jgi:hypothetical protein
MGIDKGTMFFYLICLMMTLGGFSLILFTRNTLIFAAGAILVFIGLFLFLIVREKTKKAAKQG